MCRFGIFCHCRYTSWMLRPGEQTCPGSDIKLPWAGRKLRTQVAYVHSQVVYVHSQVAFVHSQVAYEVYMRRKRSLSGGQGEFARQCAGITRHADAISAGCCWSSHPALACFWSRGVMLRAARYARRGRSEFAGEVETDVLEVVLRHL